MEIGSVDFTGGMGNDSFDTGNIYSSLICRTKLHRRGSGKNEKSWLPAELGLWERNGWGRVQIKMYKLNQ